MRPANRLDAGFRQTEVQHFPFGNKVLYRARDILNRYQRIDTVLKQHINAVSPQAAQLCFDHLPDMFGSAIEATETLPGLQIHIHTELGFNNDLVAYSLERFANNLLREERSVHLGRVDQGNPPFNSLPNKCNSCRAVKCAVVEVIDRSPCSTRTPLAAKTDRKYIEFPQFTSLP